MSEAVGATTKKGEIGIFWLENEGEIRNFFNFCKELNVKQINQNNTNW